MFWVVSAIIAAGYLIALAIREAGQRQAAAALEASRQQAAIELERIKNSREYREQAAAIQDYLDFRHSYFIQLWAMRSNEARLKLGQLTKPERDSLARSIRAQDKELHEMGESFAAKYEGSPYDPSKLPFNEWPPELRARYDEIEAWKDEKLEEVEASIQGE